MQTLIWKTLSPAQQADVLTRPALNDEADIGAVVKEIIGSERQRFPGHILKGFIRSLSTYPVGSWVRLNTGEMARIAATNERVATGTSAATGGPDERTVS